MYLGQLWGQLVFAKAHNIYNFNHLNELFGSRRLHQTLKNYPCGGFLVSGVDDVDENPCCGLNKSTA